MSRSPKIVLAVTLSLYAGAARSQAPAPVPAAPGAEAPPAASDVDIRLRQRPTLSPQEMVAQAKDYRNRLEQLVTQVQAMVEQARQSKDVIRLNCLLDRLAQMKASVNIADTSLQNLQEAGARNDEGATLHEYTRITIVHQKAQVLMGEAQSCAGEDLSYVGATRVDVAMEGVPTGNYTGAPLVPTIYPPGSPIPNVAGPDITPTPLPPSPGGTDTPIPTAPTPIIPGPAPVSSPI
jgi:hypothetical protein